MSFSVKTRQTKIPFTERKLRSKTKKLSPNTHEEDEVFQAPTPTKRQCLSYEALNKLTPVSNKTASTPSSAFSKLILATPKCEESDLACGLKRSLSFLERSSAMKALHSSSSDTLPCREGELEQLRTFLLTHLKDGTCGSLYLSGLPGTGKTASLNHVIQHEEISKGYHIMKINCTSISSSKAIYKRICEELKIKVSVKSEKESLCVIENYLFTKKHKMILLILDEIDQLETKTQSVLYKIFEWPSQKNAKLVLIGIANAMDLTDRILPRLCAKVGLKPILMHFAPYSKEQITKILTHRLSEGGANTVFAPSALELISAKVAGMSGDIRRALDLGRRVMEMSGEKKQSSELTPKKTDVRRSLNEAFKASKMALETFNCGNESSGVIAENSPKKMGSDMMNNKCDNGSPHKSLRKLSLEKDDKTIEARPRKSTRKINLTVKAQEALFEKSPRKVQSSPVKPDVCLQRTPLKCSSNFPFAESPVRKSPRKLSGFSVRDSENIKNYSPEKSPMNSPAKVILSPRKSPRKLNFTVDSKDVMSVVKNIYGASKNFKSSEDSSFPLHQKLLICTLLLVLKKGKSKDLNVGRLHQVYSKVCAKQGITAVDQSGFLFLCRQVEMTGIIQLGKGPGKLAKVALQWDEVEVTNSLKDVNLLSSILNDISSLS